jgi:hypothetical protein
MKKNKKKDLKKQYKIKFTKEQNEDLQHHLKFLIKTEQEI